LSEDRRFTVPLFTIDEAAHHLGLPRTTLRDWTRRQAGPAPLVHRICDPLAPRSASLPFVAIIEAHMLRGFRELGLSAQGLRDSVARLRQNLDDEYALATRKVATDGVDLLVDLSEHGEPAEWTRAIDNQLAIREVIEDYLKFVRWGNDPHAMRLRLRTYQGADVIIDPRFAFGQPVLERQKVRVEDILDAFWAGEGYVTIAKEFGVRADEVEAVVRSATRPRTAA
jgi:uncharacterized protein (DUF433 family)